MARNALSSRLTCWREGAAARQHAAMLILACATSVACGSDRSESTSEAAHPISGGELVAAGAWPNVVLLDRGCTGFIVSRELVVFAAHCGIPQVAWLGDEFQLDLDEHAQRVDITPLGPAEAVGLERCQLHPDAMRMPGLDIAYCFLSRALDPRLVVPIALGCEAVQARADGWVKLVGFGVETHQGTAGLKRSVDATITGVGKELRIGSATQGACRGDSGGPAFLRVAGPDGEADWRAVGVLSSGVQGSDCSVGYFTPIASLAPWLEEQSGRELTPCFDRNLGWAPSPRCLRASLDVDGNAAPTASATASSSCGPPFDGDLSGVAPRVVAVAVERTGSGPSGLRVSASVEGGKGGIEAVSVELRARDGALLESALTEIAPYEVTLHSAQEAATVRVTATDYAGEADSYDHDVRGALVAAGGSCAVGGLGRDAPSRRCFAALAVAVVLSRCRRHRRRTQA